ncbi:MAG: hypothetical protein EA409_04885 [Saprospirales bacterium]|nr:MAG: hypothetical protein EA409_04885 [Saprospirales bacterium]
MKFNRFYFTLLLSVLFLATSCVKEDFDEPPAEGTDPNITVNATIADVKAFYQPGNYVQIDEDLVFSAIVTADDRSGNLFRNLVLQDETGGIQIRFNFTDLHNNYPIGRRLFIRARDMYISDFNGTLQLGGGVERDAAGNPTGMDGVPLPLADKFILRGKWNQDYEIPTKRVDELTDDDINTVIRLENFQFRSSDLGETFAISTIDDEGNQIRQTVNRDLISCTGDAPIVVRTSGFADFATTELPQGSGSIVGVYTVFGTVKQLLVREIEDVNMEAARCDASVTSISSIRGQFTGSPTNVSGGTVIRGIVISDKDNLSVAERNLFFQDESGGIAIRFNGNHSFPLGAELEIDVSGNELSTFQGLLQINNVDLLSAEVISQNNTVTPRELTISELQANFNQYESTLIRIRDVSMIKEGDQQDFAFTTILNDGTATIDHFTRPQATFSNNPIPTIPITLTGIVSVGGTQEARQVSIRNLNDIDGEDVSYTNISSIRDAYSGTPANIEGGTVIRGIVISDRENLNVAERNMFLQDQSGGIAIRFTGNHSFDLGHELEIDVSGDELSVFQGLLQINNVNLSSAITLSQNNSIIPNELTISELQANFNQYESTLVRVRNVTMTKEGNQQDFAFTTTLNDGTATIDHFTRPQATFANQAIPTEPITLTGIVSVGGTQEARQIGIRNLDDVDGDISGPETLLFEDFQAATVNEPISLPGWTNVAEIGSNRWTIGEFSGNRFGTVSAFQSADAENKMWLITPEFEVDSGVKFEFESAQGFHVQDGLRVYISNNFDGSNPTDADWTELDATIAGAQEDRWAFISSGTINLGAFTGQAHIAFVYEGSNPAGETTTYRIDNVRVFKD